MSRAVGVCAMHWSIVAKAVMCYRGGEREGVSEGCERG